MSLLPSIRPWQGGACLGPARREWPSDGWWKAFGDSQLDALIAEGLAGATDLRVVQARFGRSLALVSQSRSQLLPSVIAGAEGRVSMSLALPRPLPASLRVSGLDNFQALSSPA